MAFIHSELAAGRWHTLPLIEQLGNVGSEVSRAIKWRGRDERLYEGAIDRGLELLDLTLADPRWRGARLREIARAREVLCDAITDGEMYRSTLQDMDRYFLQFALAARATVNSSAASRGASGILTHGELRVIDKEKGIRV